MKRAIIAVIVLAGMLELNTMYAWAVNCGDTWATTSPETSTGHCSEGLSNPISKTVY
jgi:hypothetical protein